MKQTALMLSPHSKLCGTERRAVHTRSHCPANANVDGDGLDPDVSGLVYLVAYMFSEGPPPVPCP